jgi:hypothetical protein
MPQLNMAVYSMLLIRFCNELFFYLVVVPLNGGCASVMRV